MTRSVLLLLLLLLRFVQSWWYSCKYILTGTYRHTLLVFIFTFSYLNTLPDHQSQFCHSIASRSFSLYAWAEMLMKAFSLPALSCWVDCWHNTELWCLLQRRKSFHAGWQKHLNQQVWFSIHPEVSRSARLFAWANGTQQLHQVHCLTFLHSKWWHRTWRTNHHLAACMWHAEYAQAFHSKLLWLSARTCHTFMSKMHQFSCFLDTFVLIYFWDFLYAFNASSFSMTLPSGFFTPVFFCIEKHEKRFPAKIFKSITFSRQNSIWPSGRSESQNRPWSPPYKSSWAKNFNFNFFIFSFFF